MEEKEPPFSAASPRVYSDPEHRVIPLVHDAAGEKKKNGDGEKELGERIVSCRRDSRISGGDARARVGQDRG